MSKGGAYAPMPALMHAQAKASHPASSDVWLSASAGTGKTQVLTARVLRLLLHGAAPGAILCLTFTKAGAAEMANRINAILGQWVQARSGDLAADLKALGEDFGPDARAKARTLFARVLDARGGGLRIQTIHSFCQTLLAGFPAEAGLVPGFRPIEGREESALARSVLADLVANAERTGQLGLVERLEKMSQRLGEDGARKLLERCARDPDAMEALGPGIEARVRRWLGLGDADPEAELLSACTDGGFDRIALEQILSMNRNWNTARGLAKAEAITRWLAMTPIERRKQISLLTSVWATNDGELRSFAKGQAPQVDGYVALAEEQYAFFNGRLALCTLVATAEAIANALVVGQAYARAYADAKRAIGAVDFNDLIRLAAELLGTNGMGEWIRFKLDQATDHILVDEAQDTNARQWDIIKAIAEEFYAGEGARPGLVRTLFTVGDYKQAIFGFQGTNPEEFGKAQRHFTQLASDAERTALVLSLSSSYRSGTPVLDLVNAVIDAISPEAMGLEKSPGPHRSARAAKSGSVTLWAPVSSDGPEGVADAESEGEEEQWLAGSELVFARQLAERIKAWTKGPDRLRLRNEGRDAEPGDVLVLVRKRGDLARTIVSRLHEAGVPVAGVDRLSLDAPIVVQDLMACIRFVLQPDDDLNLACLLVSPLIGWSQKDLYERGKQRRSVSLWQHLGDLKPPALLDLLNMADFTTPHRFLETILSGPMEGRRKCIARLGEEARDPIEELLNQALAFERTAPPLLQPFVDWFDRGAVEIKRDAAQSGGAVRVMTVHGAKGLQAPIVVLADATGDPEFRKARELDWEAEDALSLPIFRPRKEELVGSLKESATRGDQRELEEHWRLLYVALTRAEEHLFIGGALKPRQQSNGMGEKCWHTQIERALESMAVASVDGARHFAHKDPEPKPKRPAGDAVAEVLEMPPWALRTAPVESRPPRPLAPSAIQPGDTVADPPPSLEMRAAAARGTLLHSLFERLPAVAPDRRARAAEIWLEKSAGVLDGEVRSALAADALRILDDPRFASLFAADALAEAPIAGVVEGQVIAGTVDRLLIREKEVLVVDFKTGRRVPQSADAVPPHHKAQMAAYVWLLRAIFPDREVRGALLYTSGPEWIALSDADLEPHKPGYRAVQDNLPRAG